MGWCDVERYERAVDRLEPHRFTCCHSISAHSGKARVDPPSATLRRAVHHAPYGGARNQGSALPKRSRRILLAFGGGSLKSAGPGLDFCAYIFDKPSDIRGSFAVMFGDWKSYRFVLPVKQTSLHSCLYHFRCASILMPIVINPFSSRLVLPCPQLLLPSLP